MISHAVPFLVAAGTTAGVVTATTEPSAGLAPYVGGGATMILATALAEVMRRMLNGRLISRETREQEIELGAAIVAAGQREAEYMKLAVDARDGAAKVAAELAIVTKSHTAQITEAMNAMTVAMRDLREEIRTDRRERDR